MCLLHMSSGAFFARELLHESRECDAFVHNLAQMREAYAAALGTDAVERIVSYRQTQADSARAAIKAYAIRDRLLDAMPVYQRLTYAFAGCSPWSARHKQW